MMARSRFDISPLPLFLAVLVVAMASDVILITIPGELARFDVDGRPKNTIAAAIVTYASTISRVAILVSICLVPTAVAASLKGRLTTWIARALTAILLLSSAVGVALLIRPQLMVDPFSMETSILAHGLRIALSMGLNLLTIMVPLGAAIWVSAMVGGVALHRAVVVLSSAIAAVSLLSILGFSIRYFDHAAFALYTFVLTITFRKMPDKLRVWSGLLAAFWLAPFVLAWGPELIQASLIDYMPNRLDAYKAVFTQIPLPPQPGASIVPLLFGAMLAFSKLPADRVTRLLSAVFGAIILAFAGLSVFDIFVYSPMQALDLFREGALRLGAASVSAGLWLALFISPFAMTFLAVRLYRSVIQPAT